MTLGERQEYFAHEEWELRAKAWEMGFAVRPKEFHRPVEMQKIYVQQGRSKTMDSRHCDGTACDYVLLLNGVVCTRAQIKPLGDWWEARSPKHRWGGNWRGAVDSGKSSFIDAPHFEIQA